jgi:hypothetical protein
MALFVTPAVTNTMAAVNPVTSSLHVKVTAMGVVAVRASVSALEMTTVGSMLSGKKRAPKSPVSFVESCRIAASTLYGAYTPNELNKSFKVGAGELKDVKAVRRKLGGGLLGLGHRCEPCTALQGLVLGSWSAICHSQAL